MDHGRFANEDWFDLFHINGESGTNYSDYNNVKVIKKSEVDKFVNSGYVKKYSSEEEQVNNADKTEEEKNNTTVNTKIKKSTMQIVVVTKSEINGAVSITKQKIDYKSQVANYSVPMEFIFAHLQVTNSVEYATAIADMVINNSKIDYLIQDCYSETITKDIYQHDTAVYINVGENQYQLLPEAEDVTEIRGTKTAKVWSITSYIKEADIWIANISNNYSKIKNGPTTSKQNVQKLEDYWPSSFVKHTDRSTYDEVTTTTITYMKTVSGGNSTLGAGTAVDGDGYTEEYTRDGRTFREYKQGEGSYKDDPYWGSTIAYKGCGPTAVAIAASGYIDGYDPGDIAAHMGGNTGSSTLSNELTKIGLKNTVWFDTNDKNKFLDELRQGKTIIVSVNNNLNGMFTKASHIMAVLDVDDNNNVYVSNPNRARRTGTVTIDELFACIKYYITIDNAVNAESNSDASKTEGAENEDTNNETTKAKTKENILFIGDSWFNDAELQQKFPSSCTFKAKDGVTAEYWLNNSTSGVKDVSQIVVMLGLNNPYTESSMKKLIDKLIRRIS